jgi:peroxiredoxin
MARTPNVGDKAPNFELPIGKDEATGKAKLFNLHEAAKRGPVVVAFFPGAFTGTCTKEMACFTNDWNKYAALGAQFIGVSVDSVIALKAFAEKNNYKVPFASDFERRTVSQWNLLGSFWWGPASKRATFIVDRTGTVRYANVQANSDVEPNYAEIQAALKGLK